MWAIPEGRIVFAGEPLLEVTAPIAEAQLAETFLLNRVTVETTLASKAARCVVAAGGRDLLDFSFRRTHGVDAALAAARTTAMCGFVGTSNVEAARRYGLRVAGTMAHSYVEAFDSEAEAFRAFAEDFPGRVTFLVDTYDTAGGVEAAIGVIRELGLEPPLGVRLDSGDLDALARAARRRLDEAGLDQVRIFASGGLDDVDVARLVAAGARSTGSAWERGSASRRTRRTSTRCSRWSSSAGGRRRSCRRGRSRSPAASRCSAANDPGTTCSASAASQTRRGRRRCSLR